VRGKRGGRKGRVQFQTREEKVVKGIAPYYSLLEKNPFRRREKGKKKISRTAALKHQRKNERGKRCFSPASRCAEKEKKKGGKKRKTAPKIFRFHQQKEREGETKRGRSPLHSLGGCGVRGTGGGKRGGGSRLVLTPHAGFSEKGGKRNITFYLVLRHRKKKPWEGGEKMGEKYTRGEKGGRRVLLSHLLPFPGFFSGGEKRGGGGGEKKREGVFMVSCPRKKKKKRGGTTFA